MALQRALIKSLRESFAAHADPVRAKPMQAYMKSAMPFQGVASPVWRRFLREAIAAHPAGSTRDLADTMRHLWRSAKFREQRYVAAELARFGPHKRLLDLSLLPLYTEMIRDGAWWDFCDDLSGYELGQLLVKYPRDMKPLLRRWAKGDDLWLRRASFLCQRHLKSGIDVKLLYDCILPSIGKGKFADEFFIRKGIGWALRERSYAAPEEVTAFCRDHAAEISPLTRREALRVIEKGARY